MSRRNLYAIFLMSGISGLIYQVVWVRCFGQIFGNTVYSASLVIAVFMVGLGIGSYVCGKWADRATANRPEKAVIAYAYAELLIAGLAAIIALTLPHLESISTKVSFYQQSADGWYELSTWSMVYRCLIAAVMLLPITTLMGGTLTLLVRYLLATDVQQAGWRIGLLYGFNTAGGAIGALVSDFAFIPYFGLFATQMLAVTLNLAAGLLALRLARRSRNASATPANRVPTPISPVDTGRRVVMLVGLAIFLSGACAMGIEILWFRQFTIVLGSHRSVFSLLLAVILCGMWLGSITGGACHRRFGKPALLFMATQTAFLVTTVILLGFVTLHRETSSIATDDYGSSIHQQFAVSLGILKILIVHVGLPAFLMGFAYPLANAIIQNVTHQIGQRAGMLYIVNTFGAVLGSLATGFFLIPTFALQKSVTLLLVVGLLSIVALWRATCTTDRDISSKQQFISFVACVGVLALVTALWLRVPTKHFQMYGILPNEVVLDISEGVNELIAVTEMPNGVGRRLKTNGHNMSGNELAAQRYMRAFVHIPLLHLENPTDVLVICFGVGSTLHAASLHPSVQRLELADLSRHVLQQAHFFASSNHDVLNDPRLKVFINDGRQHLRMQPAARYDLITLEPPPLGFAGVSSLYSREFYGLAKSRLKPGGYVSQWLPAYQVPQNVALAMVRAFALTFPNAILLSGERGELIMLGSNGGAITIDPSDIQARLLARPAVQNDLTHINMGTPTEIIGSFFSSPKAIRAATWDLNPVTDDHSIMEYTSSAASCRRTHFPRDLVDATGFAVWCPRCVENGQLVASVAPLGDYSSVLNAFYLSNDFVEYASSRCRQRVSTFQLPLSRKSPAFEQTSYLKTIFPGN